MKIVQKKISLFTSRFHLIFFLNVWFVGVKSGSVFLFFLEKLAIFLNYFSKEMNIWASDSRLDLQRIFFFFLFCQITFSCTGLNFLLMLPLVHRDASMVAKTSGTLLCGIYCCQKFSDVMKNYSIFNWRTLFKGLLMVRVHLGDLKDFITMKMTIIAAWKGRNIWIRILNVDYTTCLKTQIVILSL